MFNYSGIIVIIAFNLIHSIRTRQMEKNTSNWCRLNCKNMKNICCIYSSIEFGSWCNGKAQLLDYEDGDRMDVVNIHNKLRYILAKGNFDHNGLRNTSAANMHTLSYSMQLEFSAGCWARQCRLERSRCRAVEGGLVGEIVCYEQHVDLDDSVLHETALGMLDFCLGHKIKMSTMQFTNKTIDKLRLPVSGDDVINREAVQMMWARTRYVGCTRLKFPHSRPSYMILLQICHYFPRGNEQGKPIFIRGEPATKCPNDGDINLQYTTLCGDIRPIELDNWQPMRVLNLIIKGVRTKIEEKNTTEWCKINCHDVKNICCMYDPMDFGRWCRGKAQMIGVKDDDKMDVLNVHNKFRYLVATGSFKYNGLMDTKAANMHVLSYSKQLEFSAGCWAKQCWTQSSTCRAVDEGKLGEIVCFQTQLDLDDSTLHEVGLMQLEACLAEKVKTSTIRFTPDIIDKLQLPKDKDDSVNWQALQTMWADTRYVGCTRIKFPQSQSKHVAFLQVCHYFPGANFINHPIFIRGEPASQCQNDERLNLQYTALCGDIRPLKLDNWEPSRGRRNTWCTVFSLHLLYLQHVL